ncbi:C4-dicarboxylate transporter DcuC [Serratia fonticola]|uniref:C4-dicarboxylate transporter DcuC n=1 Tax=Serratia fonticola TaxID=47917 RepID=A0A4U9TFH0_SERFO|nr:C4-dicarboxylate transporter DcuC [Serratia fonticola]
MWCWQPRRAEMPLVDFAFKTTLPISIAAIVCMAIAHFFWQRYLDRKSQRTASHHGRE